MTRARHSDLVRNFLAQKIPWPSIVNASQTHIMAFFARSFSSARSSFAVAASDFAPMMPPPQVRSICFAFSLYCWRMAVTSWLKSCRSYVHQAQHKEGKKCQIGAKERGRVQRKHWKKHPPCFSLFERLEAAPQGAQK